MGEDAARVEWMGEGAPGSPDGAAGEWTSSTSPVG